MGEVPLLCSLALLLIFCYKHAAPLALKIPDQKKLNP
jgi:hypothetical protein